jgi:hypothetical protein
MSGHEADARAAESPADVRARETEQQMTDDQ